MQTPNIEDLMALDWHPHVESAPDEGVLLRVPALEDFVVYAESEDEAWREYPSALRSHLQGYLNCGKVIPVQFAIRQDERVGLGEELTAAASEFWLHVPSGLGGQRR